LGPQVDAEGAQLLSPFGGEPSGEILVAVAQDPAEQTETILRAVVGRNVQIAVVGLVLLQLLDACLPS